jgi:hypothetical protein
MLEGMSIIFAQMKDVNFSLLLSVAVVLNLAAKYRP